jgi:hypothetical protein
MSGNQTSQPTPQNDVSALLQVRLDRSFVVMNVPLRHVTDPGGVLDGSHSWSIHRLEIDYAL